MAEIKYKRILLKVSGEGLCGPGGGLSGSEINAAILQEVTEIASDLLVISTTSGSRETTSWTALTSPCHNSSNLP